MDRVGQHISTSTAVKWGTIGTVSVLGGWLAKKIFDAGDKMVVGIALCSGALTYCAMRAVVIGGGRPRNGVHQTSFNLFPFFSSSSETSIVKPGYRLSATTSGERTRYSAELQEGVVLRNVQLGDKHYAELRGPQRFEFEGTGTAVISDGIGNSRSTSTTSTSGFSFTWGNVKKKRH